MKLNLKYKNMSPENIPQVSRLYAKSWKYAYGGLISDEYLAGIKDDRWVETLKKGLADGSKGLLVYEGETLAGASFYRKSMCDIFPEDGELVSIYLDPDFIGRRIGAALYSKTQCEIIKDGYRNLILDVLEGNKRAIDFYLKNGFDIVLKNPVKFDGLELNCLIMRKKLY